MVGKTFGRTPTPKNSLCRMTRVFSFWINQHSKIEYNWPVIGWLMSGESVDPAVGSQSKHEDQLPEWCTSDKYCVAGRFYRHGLTTSWVQRPGGPARRWRHDTTLLRSRTRSNWGHSFTHGQEGKGRWTMRNPPKRQTSMYLCKYFALICQLNLLPFPDIIVQCIKGLRLCIGGE